MDLLHDCNPPNCLTAGMEIFAEHYVDLKNAIFFNNWTLKLKGSSIEKGIMSTKQWTCQCNGCYNITWTGSCTPAVPSSSTKHPDRGARGFKECHCHLREYFLTFYPLALGEKVRRLK